MAASTRPTGQAPLARPRPSTTLRRSLSWLVAACLLPVVLLLTGLVYVGYIQKRELASRQVQDAASAIAAATDRELQSVVINLEVLAMSPTIAAGDYHGARREAEALIARHYPGAGLALFAPDGSQHYNTFRPEGARLPRRPDRTGIDAVMATRQPRVVDGFMSAVGHGFVVPIDVPVFDQQGGITSILSMATSPAVFLDVLTRQHLPADWIVNVLDRNGTIVARIPDHAGHFGRPANAYLRGIVTTAAAGIDERVAADDGQAHLVSWRATGDRGWHVAVCVPRSSLFAPLARTLLQTLLLAAIALIGAVALARRAAGRIAAPIGALVILANEQHVCAMQPVASGLTEADAVAMTLVAARQQRAAAQEALAHEQARNLAELEDLVQSRTAELRTAENTLLHAQRMEALGQLAGGIAHDFNNVLQAIQGGGGLIRRHAGHEDQVHRYATMILDAAQRGAAVTRRLLAFSRRADLRAEAVSPIELLSGLRDVLAHTLGTGIAIEVQADCGTATVLADKSQLETVLINLAVNARDAVSGMGLLTLSARAATIGTQPAAEDPRLLKPGGYICLSVIDRGAGMDAATLARASEPFFTTKAAGKGTGLGLAMARGFAEQSGGCLHIVSRLGEGTTVSLWLPQAPAEAEESPIQTAQPGATRCRTGAARLLMVDDDTLVLQSLAEEMSALGHAVSAAPSGPAALALLDAGQPADIVVSDLSMPEMDGIAFIRAAQLRRPELPAILLTGYATNAAEIAINGALSGAFTLLRKPITAAALSDRVALLLEGLDGAPARQATYATRRVPALRNSALLAGPGD